MMKELNKRILSSILIIPIVLFFIINGSISFLLFISLIFLLTCYEWIKMSKNNELIRIFAFIIAGLSISGFPFLSGYITKLLVKSDLPNEALIIFNSSALLTSGVYVKLIISRLNNNFSSRPLLRRKKLKDENIKIYSSSAT